MEAQCCPVEPGVVIRCRSRRHLVSGGQSILPGRWWPLVAAVQRFLLLLPLTLSPPAATRLTGTAPPGSRLSATGRRPRRLGSHYSGSQDYARERASIAGCPLPCERPAPFSDLSPCPTPDAGLEQQLGGAAPFRPCSGCPSRPAPWQEQAGRRAAPFRLENSAATSDHPIYSSHPPGVQCSMDAPPRHGRSCVDWQFPRSRAPRGRDERLRPLLGSLGRPGGTPRRNARA
jgi:hypothetical protein